MAVVMKQIDFTTFGKIGDTIEAADDFCIMQLLLCSVSGI